MANQMHTGLKADQLTYIADVLQRLREHFHQWPGYEGREHDLVGFAYYEGCGDTECCGDLLVEAAPVALGAELVARHGFAWKSLESGILAVTHPALANPIVLTSLEEGTWCDDSAGTLSRGETTHESLAGIVRAVGGKLQDE